MRHMALVAAATSQGKRLQGGNTDPIKLATLRVGEVARLSWRCTGFAFLVRRFACLAGRLVVRDVSLSALITRQVGLDVRVVGRGGTGVFIRGSSVRLTASAADLTASTAGPPTPVVIGVPSSHEPLPALA
jgi:hypothetical protein